ncbi:hypothetical protein [Marinimicrobium alkaliphilum]|uniref:hypothetical protein n=1 Tax=Marinimicrobium alkaliphilum TaxID=2202654 RepID=UPI000DB95679|nr:hypothetical protein [Marinimicrobium alkaliphilum]
MVALISFLRNAVIIFLTLGMLFGCQQEKGHKNMTSNEITIALGTPTQELIDKHPSKGYSRIDKQPAGLNFYKINWNTNDRGTVHINHGNHSLTIPYATSVTGTEDTDRPELGIQDFLITAGLNSSGEISHDDALKTLSSLISNLLDVGWKPLLWFDDPRLSGAEAFKYYQKNPSYGIPPDYRLCLDEWMALRRSIRWRLFAGDATLSIRFQRDSQRLDIEQPGSYLISFNLSTTEKLAKNHFEQSEQNDWKALWPDMIKSLKRQRYAKEAILEEKGFTINHDYQDPIIHPDDPIEVED